MTINIYTVALDIMRKRAEYYNRKKNYERAVAYESCATMLEYAIKENWECLEQFDDYSLDNKLNVCYNKCTK
jgi:hypothetical protein